MIDPRQKVIVKWMGRDERGEVLRMRASRAQSAVSARRPTVAGTRETFETTEWRSI